MLVMFSFSVSASFAERAFVDASCRVGQGFDLYWGETENHVDGFYINDMQGIIGCCLTVIYNNVGGNLVWERKNCDEEAYAICIYNKSKQHLH